MKIWFREVKGETSLSKFRLLRLCFDVVMFESKAQPTHQEQASGDRDGDCRRMRGWAMCLDGIE